MSQPEVSSQTAPEAALSAVPSELVQDTTALLIDSSGDVPSTVTITAATATEEAVEQGAKVNPKRLYLSNVSYQTTENDLKELFKKYEIVSVLVPSHTVRGFTSIQQKSFGIAYVEFASESDAELAKKETNGKIINERALRVKTFVTYSPKHSFINRSRSRRGPFGKSKHPAKQVPTKIDEETLEKGSDATVNQEETDEVGASEETPAEEDADQVSGSSSEPNEKAEEQEVSKDTVFISRLSPKTTDGDLRLFFHEFSPTDVYIFKNRFSKKQHPLRFHQRHVSALVTLADEDGIGKAIETLANEKIKGKAVVVRAAFVSKVEDVKKAAASRQKKQEKLEQDANAAAQAAIEKIDPEKQANDSIDVAKEQVFEGFDN